MDDEARVSEAHRLQHLEKQGDAGTERERVVVGVARDRHAVDPLHRQVGEALGAGARVVETGDVRMLEAGEKVALVREARRHRRRVLEPRVRDLEGDAANDVDGLLGEPDRRHAAFADALEQAIGPEHPARRQPARTALVRQGGGEELCGWRAEGVVAAGSVVRREQPGHMHGFVRMLDDEPRQPRRARRRVEHQRFVEQLRNPRPELGRDRHRSSCASMKARALSQWRRTVRSETSIAAAISASV